MKVVAFNGSARKSGNTASMIKVVFEELEKEGIETELVEFGKDPIKGCDACRRCFKEKNRKCAVEDDIVNDCLEKMLEADGIILGSPVYFADVSANMKAFIERVGYVARANDDMLRLKPGASVVAVRRGGAVHTYDSMNHLFGICQMITVGSRYWNLGRAREKGDFDSDEEGIETMRILGQNMAWLLRKLG